MRKTELKLRKKVLPFLIPILVINQLVSPRKVWMILLVGLALVFLLSYFWAKSLQAGLHLTREMRYGWSQVGDHLQERFNLANTEWAPAIWFFLEDHSDLAGYQASTITSIGGDSVRHWYKKGICERRGLYTIGPTNLYSGDPFGIFEVEIFYPATANMMVMPPIVYLPEIQVAAGGKIGEGVNIIRSWHNSVTAAGVREFQPGDSLRHIHWPTSARRGNIFVRTFDNTPTSDQWIFMDMNREVHSGKGENASEEHGIILAASLMNWSLENDRAVGFGAHGKEFVWHSPMMNETQKWSILRSLASLELGEEPMGRLLEVARQTIKYKSSLLIITADTSGDWIDPVLLMMKKGIIPTILLLDAPSFGGRGEVDWMLNRLVNLGINHYRIDHNYLDNMGTHPGRSQKDQKSEEIHIRNEKWRSLS